MGSITVDPDAQNARVGRALMQAVPDRTRERGFPGARLLQVAYHNRLLALYSRLGFAVREPVLTLDVEVCDALCRAVHGDDRGGEVRDALQMGSLRVVEHGGRVTGYTTGVAYLGHSAGKRNEELKALIGSATDYGGPGALVPAPNAELVGWCLERDLRIVQVMTLMTPGSLQRARGLVPAVRPLLTSTVLRLR